MTTASEGARTSSGSMIVRYWFLGLGLIPALIIILIPWWVSVSTINRELGTIRASITTHKSAIYDIVSWLMVMLLSGCITTAQLAPANSSARIRANYLSKALIVMLATVNCAMIAEFVPVPMVCVAWLVVAIGAWRG